MIKLDITGRGYELSDKIKDYVDEKIGQLDKYVSKNGSDIAGKVVLIEDASGREDNRYVCEASIPLPGATLQAKDATVNMYAAIDIVEAKLKAQAKKYKDKHMPPSGRTRRLLGRLMRGRF